MHKVLLLSVLLFFAVFAAKAQQKLTNKKDSTVLESKPTDTVKPYVNLGKIAGRRAAIRSAILPGLGQIRNGFNFYRGVKVAAIYTGATLLTISYMDNSKQYNIFVNELEYRAQNGGKSPAGSLYANSPTDRLVLAKDTYRRNKQVIIFSYVGLYLLNIVEAYIDARLANFDVGDVGDVARIKVSPDLINSNQMYGFNGFAPGMKIAISF
ncbi:MAG: DUF5683 domain-containing protein [Candidatus Pedobacter colombiensis]|uniref:DUF5683 domain-containing protein n=1 Tax=Candidatus Pedobacter colombiensis TaxID=3121371 RepID=A0AAJ5W4Z4_9SPHI|nr:DUF5683 domain-containing protein [Pedobacter sp.]WEK18623.1 MAG: DUF5683 domain-containing protein [Pedobacter sp.]